MILRHRAWSLLVLLFVLQLLHLQLATADVDGGKTNSQAVEEPPPSELVDICAPLHQAEALLKELQPSPNAHLERKIGGSAGSFGSRGWGDGLGWGHEGPLSTAFRLLPRLLNTILSPTALFSHIPIPYLSPGGNKKKKAYKVSKTRKGKIDSMLALMDQAEQAGCTDVWNLRGKVAMFPPKGMQQDLAAAYLAYERVLETTTDPEAQFMIGLFHATGLGGVEEDQGKALLYYTFSALQGYRPAEMAMGYRYWAGIGVKEECLTALDYYEAAAEKSYAHYLSGPPGGRTLPLSRSRLSDRVGGIYGSHASWASSGANSQRASVKVSSASARGETEKEILEYYQYHNDRDSHFYTVRLGKFFYVGSVYSLGGGIASGGEGIGEIPQSFTKAREYFLKTARVMWPTDFDNPSGNPSPRRKLGKEQEETLKEPAMMAAEFLGRMALRGEGMKRDYKRAKLWYERAAELGSREALNGLGIMYRDGLGFKAENQKAAHYFQASAGQDLAEAVVNLAKLHLEKGEVQPAMALLEVAIRHGSPFEAFHLFAHVHSASARQSPASGGRPGLCGVAVAWYKMVAERGSWKDDFISEGDRAWSRGEEENALLNWIIGAEMGSEVAQNNVAFLLEQGIGANAWIRKRPSLDDGQESSTPESVVEEGLKKQASREKALRWWVRSAAQDNVDAMVKVGDLYYSGVPAPSHLTAHGIRDKYELAATYYQTAADTQGSAMAYWNLGWMYEQGQGVPRDWHLAKRYYDMSSETSSEAWPAVMLSLIGLYLRSWWIEFKTRGETPGLRFFEPDEIDIPSPGLFSGLSNAIFSSSWWPPLVYDDDFDLDGPDGPVEGYEDLSGSGWGGGGGGAGAGAELDDADYEDFLETVTIFGVMFLVMALIWARGMWVRREDQRLREQEEERIRREQANDQAQFPPPAPPDRAADLPFIPPPPAP